MTRKPKSPIARWRALSDVQQMLVLDSIGFEAKHSRRMGLVFYEEAERAAIAVLKHAARKRKVK